MTSYGNYNNPNLNLWRNRRGYSAGSTDGTGSAGSAGFGSTSSAGSAGYSTSCGSLNDGSTGSAGSAVENRHVNAQVVYIHRGDNAEQRAKSYCKQNGIDVNKYPDAYNAVLRAFQSMIAQLNKLNENMNNSMYYDNKAFKMPEFDY